MQRPVRAIGVLRVAIRAGLRPRVGLASDTSSIPEGAFRFAGLHVSHRESTVCRAGLSGGILCLRRAEFRESRAPETALLRDCTHVPGRISSYRSHAARRFAGAFSFFYTDWQFGPVRAFRGGVISESVFWQQHDTHQLRLNACYTIQPDG